MWIEEREEYKRWLDWDGHPHDTRLWITGEKACGKTYLARYIVDQLRRDKRTLVLQCFLDGTTPSRSNSDAILHSTARQLAEEYPDLINTFLLEGFQTDRWTLSRLHDVWPTMVKCAVNDKGRRTIVLVDGFDNLEDEEQKLFLRCLNMAEPNHQENLRVLIVSNPGTIDLEDDPWKFRRYSITQRDVSQDIYSTVYQLLDIPVFDDQLRKTASKRIQERAEGVYLWAAVVTHDLKLSFFTLRDVEDHISGLPGKMAALYDNILGRIKVRLPKETARVRHILLWIAFRQEKLSTDELGIGLALAKYREDYPSTPVHESTFGSLYTIQPHMVRPTVIGLCGQLVRFCRDEVELVHSSLALYLTYTASDIKRLDARVEVPNHGHFHLPPQESHLLLGNLCISYLAMAPFADSGASFDPNCREQWESKVRERVRNFKLVRYAALSWTKHLRDAGRELLGAGPPTNTEADIHAQRLIETVDSHHAVCWTEVWWLVRCWPAFNYPEGSRTPGMEHILVHPPRPTNLFPHLNDQHTQSMEPPAIDPIVSTEDAPIEADEYDVPQPIGGTVTGLVSNGAGHIWAASGGTLHQQLPVVFNHHHHITANLYFTEPERTMPNIPRSGKKSRHRRRCSIL
jgi:hypothetical protein